MLSADVNPAVIPLQRCQDKERIIFRKGIIIQKYGSQETGSSEASAEFIAGLRKIFNENGILGKQPSSVKSIWVVEAPPFIADLGVEVVDCGVPLLGMPPFEITSK